MAKTKKCDWCNKRKKVSDMYRLGKFKETDKKEYWICSKCNLKHDVFYFFLSKHLFIYFFVVYL